MSVVICITFNFIPIIVFVTSTMLLNCISGLKSLWDTPFGLRVSFSYAEGNLNSEDIECKNIVYYVIMVKWPFIIFISVYIAFAILVYV